MKIPIIAALVLIAGCTTTITPVSNPAAAATSDREAVRAAMMGFLDALNALDADRMSSYFADDVTSFVPLAQADRVNGKEALSGIFQRYVARMKPTTARLNIVPEDIEIIVSGDLGVVSFNVREAAVTRRRTAVFERKNGAWLMRHLHASVCFCRSAGGR